MKIHYQIRRLRFIFIFIFLRDIKDSDNVFAFIISIFQMQKEREKEYAGLNGWVELEVSSMQIAVRLIALDFSIEEESYFQDVFFANSELSLLNPWFYLSKHKFDMQALATSVLDHRLILTNVGQMIRQSWVGTLGFGPITDP